MVMLSSHQPWDTLRACAVGISYPPEWYSYITNSRVRTVMERIAVETEEDYQNLIAKLREFNVDVVRPVLPSSMEERFLSMGRYAIPPMVPRDHMAMIGNRFFAGRQGQTKTKLGAPSDYMNIVNYVAERGNPIVWDNRINGAMVTRIGSDIYVGTNNRHQFRYTYHETWHLDREPTWPEKAPHEWHELTVAQQEQFVHNYTRRITDLFSDYRTHIVDTQGHTDGSFSPVCPGLIVSLVDIQNYAETFPGWEVIYLPEQSWNAIPDFTKLKRKNHGKWWVPGEELNDDFTDFVELWLNQWVGYVEETVFDVNMLVIDRKNVLCNNYNKTVFDALERHGMTPHIINFRHRYFWDGGLHCITSDLDRIGQRQDWFPGRSQQAV
jgi:hypothetical protein